MRLEVAEKVARMKRDTGVVRNSTPPHAHLLELRRQPPELLEAARSSPLLGLV